MIRDYAGQDVYVGKWLLDVKEMSSGLIEQTKYNVYSTRGTCFIEIISQECHTVSCVTPSGEGISMSMVKDGFHSYCCDQKLSMLPLVGLSFLFSEWMPGLLVCPSEVPLANALLLLDRSEYANAKVPNGDKQFIGLIEDGLLVAMKYFVGDLMFVEATAQIQNFGTFKRK